MDVFGYLSVLLSIILGLAITQVLQGLRALLIARSRVTMFWPSIAWCGLLLLVDVQGWWAMFGLRLKGSWTFVEFGIVLLQVLVLYMLAALVLPDVDRDGRVDLRAFYFAHARWFFGM